jgi:hypothetical protein
MGGIPIAFGFPPQGLERRTETGGRLLVAQRFLERSKLGRWHGVGITGCGLAIANS